MYVRVTTVISHVFITYSNAMTCWFTSPINSRPNYCQPWPYLVNKLNRLLATMPARQGSLSVSPDISEFGLGDCMPPTGPSLHPITLPMCPPTPPPNRHPSSLVRLSFSASLLLLRSATRCHFCHLHLCLTCRCSCLLLGMHFSPHHSMRLGK